MKALFACAAALLALTASFAGAAHRSSPLPGHASEFEISSRDEAGPISPAMTAVLKLWDLWRSRGDGVLNPAATSHQRR